MHRHGRIRLDLPQSAPQKGSSVAMRKRSQSPTLNFTYWFFQPLEALKRLPEDRGSVVAVMTALALFERFAKASLRHDKKRADKAGLCRVFGEYFGLSPADALVFWETIRDGFLHQAMPVQNGQRKQPYPKWRITRDADLAVSFDGTATNRIIVIHPWRFVDEVVEMHRKHPNLISSSSSFPWPLAEEGSLGTG